MSGETTPSRTAGQALLHEALLYRSRAQLEQRIRDFLDGAAAAEEPVLAALPGGNLEWLTQTLGDSAATVRFEDMALVGRNPNCLLPLIEEWIGEHGGRARVISEPLWPGRSYPEAAECLRHEALINHALAASPATILCPYDAQRLDAELLAGAELTHPGLVTGNGERRVSEGYGDPVETYRGDRWPLRPPCEPISEHRLDGDLLALRRAVAGDPIVASLSCGRRGDVVFAVNEAATNAVKHGDGSCTARIWHDGDSVVSEVRSVAGVSDPFAGRRRPAPTAVAGRGLWVINQVCDLVELRSGEAGSTLRMHVRD